MTTSWGELNKRQRTYLQAVYDADQAQEQAIKNAAARGRWNHTPASVWRWIPYNAADAALLRKIQEAGYRDEGTGSTFAALERRGLVFTKYEADVLGFSILFVQITKAGRKIVREALAIAPEKKGTSESSRGYLYNNRDGFLAENGGSITSLRLHRVQIS